MKKIIRAILHLINYINGDFAYQNYLKIHQEKHPNQQPLNRKNFLQEKARGKKINRCC